MPATAYIALGSNQGDRRALLDAAIMELNAQPSVTVVRVSSIHETTPVDGPSGAKDYLNAVAEVETPLDALSLLRLMLTIEDKLGRVRLERFGPRTIDLDLLFYENELSDIAELMLPHPRLHERLFVLQPLMEIAPGIRHPRLGKTVAELHAELTGIRPTGPVLGRELLGKRALVTGSTSGIGKAIALELAAAGADVLVHGRRSPQLADQLAARVKALGGRSLTLMADLSDPQQVEELADKAWNCWGGLDICINNAGADVLTGDDAHLSFEDKLEKLWKIDVQATMQMSRLLGERMKSAGQGLIVNMGWDQAETGMAGDSGELFTATKASVMAFSRSLALSLAPIVRVNCLAPGWIRTAWGDGASEVWQARVLRETPLARWGLPEDVAGAVRWLASPLAAFVTGQTIRINGGAVR